MDWSLVYQVMEDDAEQEKKDKDDTKLPDHGGMREDRDGFAMKVPDYQWQELTTGGERT